MKYENKEENEHSNQQFKVKSSAPSPHSKNFSLTVGPEAPKTKPQKMKPEDYGRMLMPGEGVAMAKYVVEGKRIPRRGEIGLTAEDVFKFESDGYIMSGNSNRRLEAIRQRKENQIFSALDKRTLALFQQEAKAKKEAQLLTQFRELIHSKQKASK